MTLETYTVTADPPLIQDADKPSVAQELAAPLRLSAAAVLNLLHHPSSPQWVQLATGVSTTDEAKIESFGIAGITMTPNFVRDYPDGSATANLVGFSNVNQKTSVITGQSGLEQEYNRLLTGTTGSEQVMTDPNGVAIPLAGTAGDARQGRRVHQADDQSHAAVPGAADLPAGGRQDQGAELLGRRHAAEDRRHPRHGPVAHL